MKPLDAAKRYFYAVVAHEAACAERDAADNRYHAACSDRTKAQERLDSARLELKFAWHGLPENLREDAR